MIKDVLKVISVIACIITAIMFGVSIYFIVIGHEKFGDMALGTLLSGVISYIVIAITANLPDDENY